MKKVLLSLLFTAFILTGVSFAQTPTPPPVDTSAPTTVPNPIVVKPPVHHNDRFHEMHIAMHDLRLAKEHLENAAHDYSGHKLKAIADIDQSLAELQEALDYARAHEQQQ